MALEFWAATDPGRVRDHNEDNFLVDKRWGLFIVCDGMGGHAAGEVASALAARTTRRVVADNADLIEDYRREPSELGRREAVLDLMEHAIKEACAQVFGQAQRDAERKGMGTTCSMLLMGGSSAFVAHVGDSRIYRLRGGEAEQLTEDHSLLNEMIRQGRAKHGDSIPNQNAVTRAVGVRETVEVDTFEVDLADGDRFLMCSDGLCGYFNDDKTLVELVGRGHAKHIVDRCIDFANDSGGKDNITVIAIEVSPGVESEAVEVEKVLEVLGRSVLFETLDRRELVELASLGRSIRLAPEQVLVRQGDLLGDVIIVESGRLAAKGEQAEEAFLGEGEVLGELSLVGEYAARQTYEAAEATRLFVLPREKLLSAFDRRSSLAPRVLWGFLRAYAQDLMRAPSRAKPPRADARRAVGSRGGARDSREVPAVPDAARASKIMVDEGYLKESEAQLKADLEVRATVEFDRVKRSGPPPLRRASEAVRPVVDEPAKGPPPIPKAKQERERDDVKTLQMEAFERPEEP